MSRKKILPVIILLLLSLSVVGCMDDKNTPSSAISPQKVSVTINPETLTLPAGGERKFSASVSGSGNTAVDWIIQEAAGGTISNQGLYTAPLSPGTYHVVVNSKIDPSKTASAMITVSSTLNASFGTNGTVTTAFGGIDTIKAMALQSDGKRVVGGASLDGTKTDFALARYHVNGTLDTSFGQNGVVTTSFGGSAGINALAIQADGKIVAGGNTDEFQNGAFALARYLADGTLDPTFGPSLSGKITTAPGSQNNRLNALKMQGNKILVGGVSLETPTGFVINAREVFTLMRFQADGSLDTTFGPDGNGTVKTLIANGSAEIMALEIQPNGEILAGGRFFLTVNNFVVARYDSNGSLDTSFSGDGIVVTSIGGGSEQVNALLIQPTGEIVAGGSSLNSFAIVRYTASGVEDTTFSGDGIVRTGIGSGGVERIHSLVFDTANNRIIAGGVSFNGANNSEFTLAGYDSVGTLDSGFGTGGIVTTPISAGADGIQAMHLESETIIATGFASNSPRIDFALARYDINGVLETGASTLGFDPTGFVTTAIGGGSDEINTLAVQADGKIIAAGSSFGINNVKNKDFSLARYEADGSLDTTFGVSGRVTTGISGTQSTGHDVIHAIAIQPVDGKIVVGGSAFQGNIGASDDFALARYMPDGTLDTSFGTSLNGIETRISTVGNEVINGLALQSDNKIVVAGTAFTGSNHNFIVGRYNTNGTLDTGFATSGIGTTQIGMGNSFAEAMVMQNNDMFLLAGSVGNGTNFDFALARYNANGSLDATFGNNGIVTTPIGTGHDFAKTIKIQADGKILVAGTVFSAALPGQFALARYNANGSLDTGFGNNGIVMTPLGNTQTPRAAHVFDLAIQTSDGKIIAGGFSSGVVNSRDFTFIRYNTNGTVDTSFGVDGIEISPFSPQIDEIHALDVLSDGTILAGGLISNDNGENTNFHLAAYTP
ncbi:hypothetical protein MNBD_NITROSPIRAE01-42 [hydrothermal vent metagenome]|uniref:Uncharacterized protein n=1 Tax=hydrothermal vent metagenome TaxID=652676 RepID=A0A3B1DQK2_9ZZZZ